MTEFLTNDFTGYCGIRTKSMSVFVRVDPPGLITTITTSVSPLIIEDEQYSSFDSSVLQLFFHALDVN